MSIFYFYFCFVGTKKMEYKTRQWHEKCFSCCVCKNPIGTKSFIPKEQEIYCAGCYEEKYATRCIKCKKVRIFKLKLLSLSHNNTNNYSLSGCIQCYDLNGTGMNSLRGISHHALHHTTEI